MKKFRIALMSLLLVAVVLGCSQPRTSYSGFSVKFAVTGSGPAWVVYDTSESVVSLPSVSLPWSYSFIGQKGDWVELDSESAPGDGDETCTIYVNGSVLMSATDQAYGGL